MKQALAWLAGVAVAAVFAGAAAFGVHLLERAERAGLERQIEDLRREVETVRAEVEELEEAGLAASTSPGSSLEGALGSLLGSLGAPPASGTRVAPGGGPVATFDPDGMQGFLATLADSPFMGSVTEMVVEQQLGEIERAVELHPDEREEIAAVLREQAREGMSAGLSVFSGEEMDPGRMVALTSGEEEIERILGPARYDDYVEHRNAWLLEQEEVSFRSQYDWFATRLGLDPDQRIAIEPLVREHGLGPGAMGTGRMQSLLEEGAMPTDPRSVMTLMVEDQLASLDRLSTTLAPHLDADQRERLEGWAREQRSQIEMMSRFFPSLGEAP